MTDFPLRLNPAVLRLKILASVLLAAALAVADRSLDVSGRIAAAAALPIQAARTAAAWPRDAYRAAQEHLRGVGEWRAQQQALRHRLLRAQVRLHGLAMLEEENRRLRLLADLSPRAQLERTLVAEVVAARTSDFRRQITISRGSYHDVHAGQPVLDAYGVVGQVAQVGLFQSTVLLITDRLHSMLLQNQRTRERFLAYGDQHRLLLPHVPWHSDIRVGDALHTTGLDDIYPDNFPVGTVAEIVAQPEQDFLEARVAVSAHLQHNREVLLIWLAPERSLP